VAYASSLDCIGPLARSVEDASAVLSVIAGVDPWDSTSAPVVVPPYQPVVNNSLEGLRIGLPREYFGEGLDSGVLDKIEQSVAWLKEAGATVVDVSLPHTEYGIATYYILATAEASSNLARYDGIRYGFRASDTAVRQGMHDNLERLDELIADAQCSGDEDTRIALSSEREEIGSLLEGLYSETRSEGFGAEVKRRILLGTYVLSSGYYDAYYKKAQQVRALIRRDFDAVFEEVDVVLTPATPTPAFPIGSKIDDPLEMYLSDIYTVTANLAGIPGLVVPIGNHALPPHLPVGVQLLGPHFREDLLFQVGNLIERMQA
jgi:aspartyl-tRNA(Asn)/glutamyl-tRNA(Gln) amidotransferase subunit A